VSHTTAGRPRGEASGAPPDPLTDPLTEPLTDPLAGPLAGPVPSADEGDAPSTTPPAPEPSAPAPGVSRQEQVTCPECGTPAPVTLTRRESADFCRRCDFPLFWTPTTIQLGETAAAEESRRRLPGTGGRVTVASAACPHCNEANSLSATVCGRCGLPMVVEERVAEVAPPPPPPAVPERRSLWWLWVLLALLGLSGAVVAAVWIAQTR
jgi:ssDNA-binding Zn-finger/Zn-ribbon topoisomerase 1